MKGESARLFAVACEGEEIYEIVHRLYWWCSAIKFYSLAKEGETLRIACDSAIETAKKGLEKKDEFKIKLLEFYPDIESNLSPIFDMLSSELYTEKTELKKLVKEILS